MQVVESLINMENTEDIAQKEKEIVCVLGEMNNTLRKYSIKDFRSKLPLELMKIGWSDKVELSSNSKISITSMKKGTGLCIQTGNVSRIYADLLKLQSMYEKRAIENGIIILPTSVAAKSFGGNVASYERLLRELDIFKDVISMPLLIIGFYE